MVDATMWRMDPDYVEEAVRLLRQYMDEDSASILLGVGGGWLPLLELDAEEARTEEWVETVDGICIEGSCTTTLPNLAGVEPGPVRLRHDDGIDGPVLYVGERPVLAIAGSNLTRLPEGLLHLEAADASGEALRSVAASAAGRRLVSLDIGGSDALGASSNADFVEDFPNLRALDISGFENLDTLEPIARLSALTHLTLEGCTSLRDLGPLTALALLETLDLSDCDAIEDLRPLARLTTLASLDLSGCSHLASLGPLSDLPALTELRLAGCAHIPDLAPLVRVVSLSTLDLSDCKGLESVAALRACGRLEELLLAGSSDVKDAPALSACTHLRLLTLDDQAQAACTLATCAVRRVDAAYVEENIDAWLDLIQEAASTGEFLRALLPALALGQPAPWAANALERLVQHSHDVGLDDRSTWQAVFASLLALGDPACRSGFERALAPLAPGKDVEPIIDPALEALARVPDTALQWANDLADATLDPLNSTPRATAVAASAVKFYARTGRRSALDPWLDVALKPRGSADIKRQEPAKEELPSIEDDPAALSGLVGRLVQKQPESPPVAQLVAALVGLARERPDCVAVQPFADHFVQLVAQKPESPTVARLGEAFTSRLAQSPESTPAWAAKLATAFATLLKEHPESPNVAPLAAMRNAAQEAGVGLFARKVLDHPALREKTDVAELDAFARAFDGRGARRALIRGLVDTLCNEDILRNKPKQDVIAILERDFVDVD